MLDACPAVSKNSANFSACDVTVLTAAAAVSDSCYNYFGDVCIVAWYSGFL
jgi:hypothetical protein